MIPEWKKGDWLTWLPCSLLLEIDRRKEEKCQVLMLEKAYECVEKVPKNKVDKLPEDVISYRLQFAAREKREKNSPPSSADPQKPVGSCPLGALRLKVKSE